MLEKAASQKYRYCRDWKAAKPELAKADQREKRLLRMIKAYFTGALAGDEEVMHTTLCKLP
jgi:hypothetical protein